MATLCRQAVFLPLIWLASATHDVPVQPELPPTAERCGHYMIVFGQERDSLTPRLSHTYAAFVKARPDRRDVEVHTISWLPASLAVRLIGPPVVGVNLDLKASLSLGMSLGTRIMMWGPYRIHKELYDRAVRQETRLKQRAIKYKAVDNGFRPNRASNCFHAVSDIDLDHGMLDTGSAHGGPASAMVVNHLRRWIIDPDENNDWLIEKLGLTKYPIQRELGIGVYTAARDRKHRNTERADAIQPALRPDQRPAN